MPTNRCDDRIPALRDIDDCEWRDVPDYAGWYAVSRSGRVARVDGECLRALSRGRLVGLYRFGVAQYFSVPRIVLEAFVEPPPDDNSIATTRAGREGSMAADDLCWSRKSRVFRRGSKPNLILTDEQVAWARERVQDVSISAIARDLDVSRQVIAKAIVGKTHRDVPGARQIPMAAGSFRHPNSKLSASDAMDIRRRRADGERGVDLALEYGVSESLVCHIVRGDCWKRQRGAA